MKPSESNLRRIVRRCGRWRALPVLLFVTAQLLMLPMRGQEQQTVPWTQEEKLYAYSKFWAEAKRNFVYMYKVGGDRWDSLYRALMPEVLASRTDAGFVKLMERFGAFLHDGHTYVSSDFRRGEDVTTTYFRSGISLWTGLVEDRLVVLRIDSLHAGLVPPGSELVAVDGVPAMDYLMANSWPYVAAFAPHVRLKQSAQRLLMAAKGTRREVTFRVGKELKTMELVNDYVGPYSRLVGLPGLERQGGGGRFGLSWPEKDIACVRIGTLSDDRVIEQFDAAFPELQRRARGVIIDLRDNGGGSTGRGTHILSHFTPKTHLTGSRWSTRCYKPAYASWGAASPSRPALTPADTAGNRFNRECYLQANDLATVGGGAMEADFAPGHPCLEVPVAVLTNSNTASACEDFLVFADSVENVFQVGEPTNGSTGNPIFIDLIPGLSCRICTKKDIYPDGREFVGRGIMPDVLVPVTLESLRKNEDIQLRAAVAEIKKRLR